MANNNIAPIPIIYENIFVTLKGTISDWWTKRSVKWELVEGRVRIRKVIREDGNSERASVDASSIKPLV